MAKEKITYVSLEGNEDVHRRFEEALAGLGSELGKTHPMYIGGKEVRTSEQFEVRSPIDRDILVGTFQKGGEREARQAVVEGKSVSHHWEEAGWKKRVGAIRNAADILERELYLMAALMAVEVGKDRTESVAEMGEGIDMIRYYCDVYQHAEGFEVRMKPGAPGERCTSVLRPHGLWVVIAPFNFPFALAAGMTSAALLAGNSVVFKPTSEAPLTGILLYRAYERAGIPAGVMNCVTGPGGPFGNAIIPNPDVDGISFTGSRAVGMQLFRDFAKNQPYPKPMVAELGSKNPVIVTAGADPEKAVEGVVHSAFGYSGQKCSATSRVYVDRKVSAGFLDLLKDRVDALKVGDPRERGVFMGPVIDEKAKKTFSDAVAATKADGGTILTGGELLNEGMFSRGAYAMPTVVTGLPKDHRLSRDELFVPFLVVHEIDNLEEGLREANDTEYGLTAGIFSEDDSEVQYFFDHIESGVTYANRAGGATTGAWPGAQSFGGWKGSGMTGKGVGGPYYLLSYMREQSRTRV